MNESYLECFDLYVKKFVLQQGPKLYCKGHCHEKMVDSFKGTVSRDRNWDDVMEW
jgi:hypothetical protein